MYELSTITTDLNGEYIQDALQRAKEWHRVHVKNNASPKFNEKRDKVFLDILRKTEVQSADLETLAKEAAVLEAKIETIRSKADLDVLEKQLKKLKGEIKPAMVELFGKNDEVVSAYGWKVKKSEKVAIDKGALETDNLLEKYSITTVSYTMTKEKTNG